MNKISLEDAVLFFIKNHENLEKYYIKLHGHVVYLVKKTCFLRYCRFFGLTFGYTKKAFHDAVIRIIIHCKQTHVDSDQLLEEFIGKKNFDMIDKNPEIKIALQHILHSNKDSHPALVQTPFISNSLPINPCSAHKLLKIPRFQEAPSIPLIEMIEAELDEYSKRLESLASYICTEKLKKNRAREAIANEFYHVMSSIKDCSLKILSLYQHALGHSKIAVIEETAAQSEFQLEDLKAKLKGIESHLRAEIRQL